MKNLLVRFSGDVLTREQMRNVSGGFGSCTFSCSSGKKSCTSASGKCSSFPAFASKEWIKCDDTTYNC